MKSIIISIIFPIIFISCEERGHTRRSIAKKESLPGNQMIVPADTIIKQKIAGLKSDIDTIILYKVYCINAGLEKEYMFWISNGKKYMQNIREEAPQTIIRLDSSGFMNTFISNVSRIKTEEIKQVAHLIKKSKRGDIYQISTIDHTCFTRLSIFFDTMKIEKSISHFDLESFQIDAKTPNDNYYYNQHTILKKLKDLAERQTSSFK